MKMIERYRYNKSSKVGDELVCPACGTMFVKTNYQQAFCRTKGNTVCKDKYWNTVDPKKRNNTTRISPASRAWMERMERADNEIDRFHPFEGLNDEEYKNH